MLTLVKFLVGICFLTALFYFELIDLQLLASTLHAPYMLALAFCCLLSTVFISALRWKILMDALETHLGFQRTLSFTFIGQFFNIFLPGGYGGDLMRVGLAHKQNPGHFSSLVISSIVDRLCGLSGLLVIALVSIPLIPSAYQGRLLLLVLAILGFGAAGLFIAFRYRSLITKIIDLIPKPLGPLLLKMYVKVLDVLGRYGTHKTVLFLALGLSVGQYILVLFALFVLGQTMGMTQLSWSAYFISGAMGLIANALPLAPGGLGVGETVFGKMASTLSMGDSGTAYSTAFLAQRVLTMLTASLGLVPFLTYRQAIHTTVENARPDAKTQAGEPA